MNKIVILHGIVFQILGVVLLASRLVSTQPWLVAMSVWLLLLGIGLLLYANALGPLYTKQDAGRKTPSVNRHLIVKPCPEASGPCPFDLACVHSGPCPLTFDYCPEAPQIMIIQSRGRNDRS